MLTKEELDRMAEIDEKKTKVSNALSLIKNPTETELDFLDNHYRSQYVQDCENSSECRPPASEDLDRWWPRSA